MKFVCVTIVLMALASLVSCSDEKVVVCYVGTWATYRPGLGKFDVDNIDPELCSHLIYTFVGLAYDSSVVSLDAWLDLNSDEGGGRDNFRKFNALKAKNPNLKTLLAVGGYNEGSAKFSQMAASPSRRQIFISSALAMVQKYGFDGLDIDWEYPNQRDSTYGVTDIENLTVLLKELKEEFQKNGLLVTIAVAAVEKSAALSYDVVGVSSNVDFVHLMTYDLHGAWDPTTGHNAGLYKSESELSLPVESEFTVHASVQYWLNQGCPPEKLVVGMPLYGRTFTLSDATVNGVGAPISGPGISGPFTVTAGLIAYNEFCDILQKQSWNVHYDEQAMVPFAVQNRNWVSFDNPESIAEKVDYVLKYNLAGAMVWSLESDDFNAVCQSENYPLLRTINRNLRNANGSTTTTTSTSATTVEPGPTEDTSSTTTTTALPSTTESSTPPESSSSSESSTTTTTESSTKICEVEGRIPNPNDCSSFYYCVRNGEGFLDAILFKCPQNLYWDQNIQTCNYASLVSCSE